MKKIPYLIFSTLLVLNVAGFSTAVNAERAIADKRGNCRQSSDCSRPDPKEHMTSLLALRDEQVEAVMAVLKASHEKRMSLHDAGRDQHRALHEQTLQQLEPLLDDEQMTRFKRFAEEMKQKHQPRMKGSSRDDR